MKALVTGGAGFNRSHLCDALIASGDEVVAIGDHSSGRESHLLSAFDVGVTFRVLDVADREGAVNIARVLGPNVEFHLGSMAITSSEADQDESEA